MSLGFEGREDSHLCGLTSNFIAVNGFGDILTIGIDEQVQKRGICGEGRGFWYWILGAHEWRPFVRDFFACRVISENRGMCQEMKETRNEKGAEDGEELCM
jgi:hypothetical protein